MPYAAEYREAAARYTGLAENLNRQAALLSGWSVASQVGSGPVAAAVAERLALIVGDLSRAADEMARLARVCGQRRRSQKTVQQNTILPGSKSCIRASWTSRRAG